MNPTLRFLQKHGLKVSLPLLLLATACGEGTSTSAFAPKSGDAAGRAIAAAATSTTNGLGVPTASSTGLRNPDVTLPDDTIRRLRGLLNGEPISSEQRAEIQSYLNQNADSISEQLAAEIQSYLNQNADSIVYLVPPHEEVLHLSGGTSGAGAAAEATASVPEPAALAGLAVAAAGMIVIKRKQAA